MEANRINELYKNTKKKSFPIILKSHALYRCNNVFKNKTMDFPDRQLLHWGSYQIFSSKSIKPFFKKRTTIINLEGRKL